MSVFSWLLIGHLVGDWLLQNDWMAKGKRENLLTTAGIVHFAIYTLAITSTLLIADLKGKEPIFIWTTIILIFVSHWLIDATNVVERWMRFYQQSNIAIVRVMVDQTLHLLFLAGLALVCQ